MVRRMHVRLIVNPQASGVRERLLGEVADRLSAVADLEVARTERAGHAEALASELERGSVAVAFGGDGTANEVVNGLGPGVRFAVLPGGASSVFARQLGFSPRPANAADQLASALAARRYRTIGMGDVDGRRFTFAASLGFDAETTRLVDEARRAATHNRRPGDLHVLATAFGVVRRQGYALHERMTLEAGGRAPMRASYVAIGSQHPYTYFGRVPVQAVPRATFESGLDAAVAAEIRSRDLWKLAVYALVWPRHASRGDPRIAYLHDLRDLTVTCDEPTPVQIDGEYVGHRERVRVRYHEAAVEVYLAA